MLKSELFALMNKKGIVFDGAKNFITEKTYDVVGDAAVTASNSGVPLVMTTYVDPKVIEILTAPINTREIFNETRKGDWTTPIAMFRTVEAIGETTAYTDFGNGAMADVNVTYPQRDNYVGQIHIRYGQREMAISGRAQIELVSEKQTSAALSIDKALNEINLFGVAGKYSYGLLNDPNIPTALTPTAVGGVTLWRQKDALQVYDDILKMAAELFKNSKGLVDQTSPIVLAIPPELNVVLGKTTALGITVRKMIEDYFTNIKFVIIPELEGAGGTSGGTALNAALLLATEIRGLPVGEFGYSDKMRTLPVVTHASFFEQKFAFGGYGCILYRPYAICKMVGC